MQVGRQKGNFRLRVIDLRTGKSKTTTIYAREQKITVDELIKRIVEGLTQEN